MSIRIGRWSAAVACGFLATLLAAPPAVADTWRDQQWHLTALNVAEAHRHSQGEGVIVGVLDSGVKADHQDLAGSVLPGVNLSGNGGPDGREDPNGHGTGMAGLIAAHGHGAGNADGALGVAPRARIFPARMQQSAQTQMGDPTQLPPAIEAAVRGGAKVLCIAQGGGSSAQLSESIKAALAADIVVVAAIGNKPGSIFPNWPAAYDGVVAAGATDQSGNVAPVTVTGRPMVLTAPGVDIVSTSNSGGYRKGTGTSDSTAIIAGAAALVRSKYPNLSATEVVRRLTATATDKGTPGRDSQYGYGTLNLVGALTADVPAAGGQSSPSPSASATAPNPAGDSAAGNGGGSPVPLVLGIVVIVLGGGGLLLWLALRRRGQTPAA